MVITVFRTRMEVVQAAAARDLSEEEMDIQAKRLRDVGDDAAEIYRRLQIQAANDVQGIKLPEDTGAFDPDFLNNAARFIPIGDTSLDPSEIERLNEPNS